MDARDFLLSVGNVFVGIMENRKILTLMLIRKLTDKGSGMDYVHDGKLYFPELGLKSIWLRWYRWYRLIESYMSSLKVEFNYSMFT